MHKITVIRGDGVGPEVCDAAMRVVEATGVKCEWEFALVGGQAVKEFGTPLPAETIEKIRQSRVALKGPVIIEEMGEKVLVSHSDGFQQGQGQRVYSNVNTALRIELGAYVNVRPLRAFEGVTAHAPKLDVIVIREITEDLYSGYEHAIGVDAAEAVKITTRKASERAARFAFEYAAQRRRRRLSVIHKANVLQLTDGLFLRTAREVAADFPCIKCDDAMIDACVYNLACHPAGWDVLLMPNQYGDIISDLCAGLVGSFGLAPGASFGDDIAIFEAAHGAALDLAGLNKVNPVALILCGAMMMEHLEEFEAAQRIRDAVKAVIKEGRILTPDLGGTAKTTAMTNVIIDHL
ncbi:MAG: isocitrate/isopropylmalate dehydrogenase family protein [Acidobacteria bacterium]|nr:isocitrate/isopropylmalate dehydrogenase family protein [Acidobacteriota bacterium]